MLFLFGVARVLYLFFFLVRCMCFDYWIVWKLTLKLLHAANDNLFILIINSQKRSYLVYTTRCGRRLEARELGQLVRGSARLGGLSSRARLMFQSLD